MVVGALSLHSAADVTVAAVLLNAGRQSVVAGEKGESFGQWLSRLTDSARQMRNVLGGGDARSIAPAHAALASHAELGDVLRRAGILPVELHARPIAPVLSPTLTNLPPPVL